MFRRVEPDKFPWIGLPVPFSNGLSPEDVIRQYEKYRTDEIDAGDKRYVFVELCTETGWSELNSKSQYYSRPRNRVGFIFAVLGYDKKSHRIEFFDMISFDRTFFAENNEATKQYSSYWELTLRSIEGYSEMIKSLIRRGREDLAKEISKISTRDKILLQAIYRELGEEAVEELLRQLQIEKVRKEGFIVSDKYIVSLFPIKVFAIVNKEGRIKLIDIAVKFLIGGAIEFVEEKDIKNKEVLDIIDKLMRSIKKLVEELNKEYKPEVSSYTALIAPAGEDTILITLVQEPEEISIVAPKKIVAAKCGENKCRVYEISPSFLIYLDEDKYIENYIIDVGENDSLIETIARRFFVSNIKDRAKEIAEAILTKKGEIPETIYERALREYLHLYIMTVS
jgi:hypothetical protein